MVALSNGLIISQAITQRNVSVDLKFGPSVGIIARKMNTLGNDIKDFRTPLRRAVREVIIPSIQINFHKHGRPSWTPLAKSTIDRKGHMRILSDTGALRRGMLDINIWDINRQRALIVDLPQSIWYGKVHQAGLGSFEAFYDDVKGEDVNLGDDGAIPARPFVMIQPQDVVHIEAIFNDWVGDLIVKRGLA